MPIPAGVAKFVHHGLLTGGEVWECGFWAKMSPNFDALVTTDAAHTAANNFETDIYSTIKANWHGTTTYQGCRCYAYVTGGTTADFVGEFTFATERAGTSVSASLPMQTCLVASLRTATSGRSSRGRVYLPLTGGSLGTGQLATTTAQGICDAVAVYLNRSPGLNVVVSQKNGTYKVITDLIVDTKPDIQRRRAAKIPPNAITHHAILAA